MNCPVGRIYNSHHATCKSCNIECIAKPAMPQEIKKTAAKKPNQTEVEYGFHLAHEFPGCKIQYEAITLHLANGHKYTADFVVHAPDGLLLVEVKNSAYKHASYGRSKLAFDQARLEWSCFRFRWAEKHSEGWRLK